MKLKIIKSKLKQKGKALNFYKDLNAKHPERNFENEVFEIEQEIEFLENLKVKKIHKKISKLNQQLQWA